MLNVYILIAGRSQHNHRPVALGGGIVCGLFTLYTSIGLYICMLVLNFSTKQLLMNQGRKIIMCLVLSNRGQGNFSLGLFLVSSLFRDSLHAPCPAMETMGPLQIASQIELNLLNRARLDSVRVMKLEDL